MSLLKEYIPSRTVRIVLGFLLGIVFVSVVFEIGIVIGARHMRYEYREFEGSDLPMPPPPFNMTGMFPHMIGIQGNHGTIGEIESVDGPVFLVRMRDGDTTKVLVSTSTILRGERTKATTSDLAPNEFVVVVGAPDENGIIQATLVRILPPPPEKSSN